MLSALVTVSASDSGESALDDEYNSRVKSSPQGVLTLNERDDTPPEKFSDKYSVLSVMIFAATAVPVPAKASHTL